MNGLFRFITDLSESGKIQVNSVLNLAASVAEKYLNVPLNNAFHFVKNLIDGKSVRQYVMPLLVDITSYFVPSIGLLNVMKGIVSGIEALFSHHGTKTVNGIDMGYSDELKIGFFKVRHKVTYQNTFFGIKVTYTTRHAR